MMKIRWFVLIFFMFRCISFAIAQNPKVQDSKIINTLSDEDIEGGWQLLWDGKTTTGWIGARLDHFPEKGWSIEDGILTVEKSGVFLARGGDIITTNLYNNFDLTLEFRLTKGANSGIKYFVFPKENNQQMLAIGCEYQILDDTNNPEALNDKSGSHTAASLYDLIPAENKKLYAHDVWNHARIYSKDGHVEHWLNGSKVVEYNRFSEAFRALVKKSKYKGYENFGQIEKGHILIQDHGDSVSFRNIKIKVLE